MGLMQLLPSTWRTEAAAAPGRPQDPYRPLDAMLTAGSYLHRVETGAAGGQRRDLLGDGPGAAERTTTGRPAAGRPGRAPPVPRACSAAASWAPHAPRLPRAGPRRRPRVPR
jgi:hypothetical protein